MWWPRLIVGVLISGVVTTALSAQSAPQTDTSGWKVYRNDTMRFEAKYPSTWRVVPVTGPETVLLRAPEVGEGTLSVQFWVQRQINPQGLPVEQWYADLLQRMKTAVTYPTTNTVIGGRPTVRREAVGTIGRHFDFFTSLNKTDIFQITITQSASQAQLDPTYETVLSTVRFLN